MDIFLPDIFLESVYKIDIKMLKDNNIKGLILDVDNTLVAQYIKNPDERLINWIDTNKKNDIKMCIVSNGSPKRVQEFNKNLNLPIISKAKKPLKKGFLKALEIMGLEKDQVAVVGDQLLTDVLGGNRLNMLTILVKRIDPKEEVLVQLKRYIEKAILMITKKSKTINHI